MHPQVLCCKFCVICELCVVNHVDAAPVTMKVHRHEEHVHHYAQEGEEEMSKSRCEGHWTGDRSHENDQTCSLWLDFISKANQEQCKIVSTNLASMIFILESVEKSSRVIQVKWSSKDSVMIEK